MTTSASDQPREIRRFLGGYGLDTLLAAFVLVAGTIVLLKAAAEPYAYTVYLAVHVVAAVVWVGGAATMTMLGIVFARSREPEMLQALGRMGGWVGPRVYTPATFVVFAFGLAMMLEGELPWNQFWVLFALAGWGLATAVGIGFMGPQAGRIGKAVQRHGPGSPQALRLVRQMYAVSRFDSALLILIVVDMTAKPFV